VSISAKTMTANLGAAVIVGTHEVSTDEEADRLEATTAADNGRARKDAGVVETRVRVVFYLDVTTGVHVFIRAGTVLTNLKFFARTGAVTPLFTWTSATVFSSRVRGQIRDRMIVEAEIEPNGDVTTAADAN
jgi:hypothetical protein